MWFFFAAELREYSFQNYCILLQCDVCSGFVGLHFTNKELEIITLCVLGEVKRILMSLVLFSFLFLQG